MTHIIGLNFVIRKGSFFEELPQYFSQTIGVLPMSFVAYFPFQAVFIVESGDMLTSQMKCNGVLDLLGTASRCVLHNSQTGDNTLVIVLDRLSQYREFQQDQGGVTDDDFFGVLSVVLTLSMLEVMFILLNQQLRLSPILPYMRLFCNESGFNAELFFKKIVDREPNSPVMAIPFPN